MSVESQKLLEILQYICFAGLILPGLAALILPDPRKKAVSLFIMFISMTILSFVFYAGIILFIVNIVFVFVFIIIYMIARRTAGADDEARTATGKRSIAVKAGGFVAAILFCSWLGYIIFDLSGGYFSGSEEVQEIYIAGLEEISTSIFRTYGIVIIIVIAAVLMTFISLILSGKKRQNDGEV